MLEILMEKVKDGLLQTIRFNDIDTIQTNMDCIVISMMEGLKEGLDEARRVEV